MYDCKGECKLKKEIELNNRDNTITSCINEILSRGNKAEIELGKDGIKILEVKKNKVWSENNN